MATYFPPPPPFVGGNQPFANHLGNVPSEAVPVNSPPFSHSGRLASLLAGILVSWIPPAPQPILPGPFLPPSIAAVPVSNPPFALPSERPDLTPVEVAWIPPPPLPTLNTKLPPSLAAVRVDTPPFGGLRVVPPATWIPADLTLILGPKLVPIVAAVVNNPPPSLYPWLPGVLASWIPAPPQAAITDLIPPSALAVRVDNPPPNLYPWLTSVIAAWIPPPAQPTVDELLPPSSSAVRVDQPPSVGVFKWLSGILQSWIPPDPLPTLSGKVPPQIAAVPVNNPPFAQSIALPPQAAPVPLPTLNVQFVFPGAVVATAAPFAPAWLSEVLSSWQPPDPLPTMPRILAADLLNIRVDSPPFGIPSPQLSLLVGSWKPIDPLPTLPLIVNVTSGPTPAPTPTPVVVPVSVPGPADGEYDAEVQRQRWLAWAAQRKGKQAPAVVAKVQPVNFGAPMPAARPPIAVSPVPVMRDEAMAVLLAANALAVKAQQDAAVVIEAAIRRQKELDDDEDDAIATILGDI